MEKLFVYGTLRDKKVQKKVFGRYVKGSNDVLEKFKRSKTIIDNKVYPAIVYSKGNYDKGKIIEISKKELKTIDRYETAAYKRKHVKSKNNKTAWVYVKA